MGIFLSRKMHYFMVLMDKRNFTKAAEELCITRSPLSKVITEIEEILGGRLFHRRHNELEPTGLALSYYDRCKHLYDSLLSLENAHKQKSETQQLHLRFDISVPENLVRHIDAIVKSENTNAKIKRTEITIDDLSALPQEKDQVICSLRPLGGANLVSCDSWEGSRVVRLRSSRYKNNHSTPRIMVWDDKHNPYFKNRFRDCLGAQDISPEFLEHNYDISTMLYMVRAGKGEVIMSEKLAQRYKTDETEYELLKHTTRFHMYYNENELIQKNIPLLKDLINKFI
ncbi:LysR family transcriptional regulator [Salmonella enterica subsp. enterica]|nr:LysR family transcriptional regulator [Salmonella enterica subsp. enterica serovar Virchow]